MPTAEAGCHKSGNCFESPRIEEVFDRSVDVVFDGEELRDVAGHRRRDRSELGEVVGMTVRQFSAFFPANSISQRTSGPLLDRLEKFERGNRRGRTANHERLRHEVAEEVDDRIRIDGAKPAHSLDGRETELAGEGGESIEEQLLLGGQKVVRPADRGRKAVVAFEPPSRLGCQISESVLESRCEISGIHHGHSSGRQLGDGRPRAPRSS